MKHAKHIHGVNNLVQEINNIVNNDNNNNIYTGGVLTLSGFRNGPMKKYYNYKKYYIILKEYDIKIVKN